MMNKVVPARNPSPLPFDPRESFEYKAGFAIGRLTEKLERKQRFDLVVDKRVVDYARAICRESKYNLFEVPYSSTESRVYGAPGYLPPEPEPPPTGSPVIMRQAAVA